MHALHLHFIIWNNFQLLIQIIIYKDKKTYKLISRKNNNAISKSNGLFIYRIFIKSIL